MQRRNKTTASAHFSSGGDNGPEHKGGPERPELPLLPANAGAVEKKSSAAATPKNEVTKKKKRNDHVSTTTLRVPRSHQIDRKC
jgi:hypothetical protein